MATKSAALKKDTGKASTSTAVAVKKPVGGSVVDANAIREQLKAQAAAMAERTTPPGGNKIQVGQDKMLKLPDGSKVAQVTGVIVDFVTMHNFYEGKFDPKNIVPPGCFAVGLNPKQMAPVNESPNKQAKDCQVCPMNEFGSAGDGKACKNGRRLALLPMNDDGTDVDAEGDILLIDVSPTAIKGFDGYVQGVARTFQTPPIGVSTTISTDPQSDYARLVFSDPQPITNLGGAMARQEEAREMLMQKPDFSGWVRPGAKAPARGAASTRR